LLSVASYGSMAQTAITNGGFENWGNTVPAGDTHTEPTNWYSNQSGSSTASLGGQTCFKDATVFHGGLYSVRVETISGPFSTVINGNVTTGVVNAPTITKADGYIGTVNYSTASDVRRMSFTGRPDSLVGWYRYTPGGAGEQGKIRAILHTADYYDPETPSTYHTDPTANKIGDLTFTTPTTAVSTWTRFSVPFTYTSASSPAYIMINVTSSANQSTTVTGSRLWLDDIAAIYNTTPTNRISSTESVTFDITASPNPATNNVVIKIEGNIGVNGTLQLLDVSGGLISTTATSTNMTTINMSGLPAGAYLVKYADGAHTQTIKINKL
jgi:hypothetical protein